jgi:putative ABC transport system permease protein
MALFRRLTAGLRALLRGSASDRDVADEVDDYLEESAAAHAARGLSPEEALRAARLELGGVTRVREEVRGYGWENAVETVIADLRYGARRLRADPGFAFVGVVTLALGIGASSAIFSAVNPILFEPLPYPHPGRIETISDVGAEHRPIDVTFGTFRELAARNRSFETMAVFKPWLPTASGGSEPERLSGQRVSSGYFRALGVEPVFGRDFEAADDRPGGPNAIILSDGLWRRRFNGDRAILGRQVRLDDNAFSVIGVMPAGFENVLAPSAELWAPLQYAAVFGPDSREWGHHLRLVARRRKGVDAGRAAADLVAIARTPIPQFARVPWANLGEGLITTPLQTDVTRGVRPALLAMLGAVLLVLIIACVNVTNLLLARGAQRRSELAMRAALGAGRGRLIRQLLTESLLLAALGGAVGVIVAMLGVRAFVALSPPGLPRAGAIRLDGAVFAFGTAMTALIGVLVGAVPAFGVSRLELQPALQRGSRRTAGGRSRTRASLVVAEIALALVLLISAGLLMQSIRRALAVPFGFDSSNLLTMQVQVPGERSLDDGARARLFDGMLDAVRRVPGVSAAAFTSQLPLSGDLDAYGVHLESDQDPGGIGSALRYMVTPGYAGAMRIPLRRGRLLDAHDGPGARSVLVNESFAARVFGSQDPLGKRLRFGPDDGRWSTIVGVVGDVKQAALALDQPDAVYVAPSQWQWVDTLMSLVVRSRGDAASLAPAIRRAIRSADKDAPIERVATMDALVRRSVADRRFAMILFEAFGLASLCLAAIGIYGVLSGSVAERRREIGVRSAMGASRGNILALVFRQGFALAGLGVACGIAGSAFATRAIAALLFGISRLDPVTYLGVIAVLAAVSGIACGVPAWRAACVDPAVTLRAE